jgi:hypothetical protein
MEYFYFHEMAFRAQNELMFSYPKYVQLLLKYVYGDKTYIADSALTFWAAFQGTANFTLCARLYQEQ